MREKYLEELRKLYIGKKFIYKSKYGGEIELVCKTIFSINHCISHNGFSLGASAIHLEVRAEGKPGWTYDFYDCYWIRE